MPLLALKIMRSSRAFPPSSLRHACRQSLPPVAPCITDRLHGDPSRNAMRNSSTTIVRISNGPICTSGHKVPTPKTARPNAIRQSLNSKPGCIKVVDTFRNGMIFTPACCMPGGVGCVWASLLRHRRRASWLFVWPNRPRSLRCHRLRSPHRDPPIRLRSCCRTAAACTSATRSVWHRCGVS